MSDTITFNITNNGGQNTTIGTNNGGINQNISIENLKTDIGSAISKIEKSQDILPATKAEFLSFLEEIKSTSASSAVVQEKYSALKLLQDSLKVINILSSFASIASFLGITV